MLLELASAADLPAIVDIYNASIPSYLATADVEAVSLADRHDWFFHRDWARRPIWVARAGTAVCGWFSCGSFYGRPAYQHTVEVALYVAPAYQGQGLGQQMLHEAIQRAPEYQIKTMMAFIFGHNQPSLHTFIKHGFEHWGRFPQIADMPDQPRDLCILGRHLDSPNV